MNLVIRVMLYFSFDLRSKMEIISLSNSFYYFYNIRFGKDLRLCDFVFNVYGWHRKWVRSLQIPDFEPGNFGT